MLVVSAKRQVGDAAPGWGRAGREARRGARIWGAHMGLCSEKDRTSLGTKPNSQRMTHAVQGWEIPWGGGASRAGFVWRSRPKGARVAQAPRVAAFRPFLSFLALTGDRPCAGPPWRALRALCSRAKHPPAASLRAKERGVWLARLLAIHRVRLNTAQRSWGRHDAVDAVAPAWRSCAWSGRCFVSC